MDQQLRFKHELERQHIVDDIIIQQNIKSQLQSEVSKEQDAMLKRRNHHREVMNENLKLQQQREEQRKRQVEEDRKFATSEYFHGRERTFL